MTRQTRQNKGKSTPKDQLDDIESNDRSNGENSTEISKESNDLTETPRESRSSGKQVEVVSPKIKKRKTDETTVHTKDGQNDGQSLSGSSDSNNNANPEGVEESMSRESEKKKNYSTLSKAMKRKTFEVYDNSGEDSLDGEEVMSYRVVDDDEFMEEDGVERTGPLLKKNSQGRKKFKTPENTKAKKPRKEETASTNEMMLQLMAELKSVKEQLKSKLQTETKQNEDRDVESVRKSLPAVRSPSADTIYVPAVTKQQGKTNFRRSVVDDVIDKEKGNSEFESELNKYLSDIRLGTQANRPVQDDGENGRREKPVQRRLDFDDVDDETSAVDKLKQASKDRIIAAEQFNLAVEAPKGMEFPGFPLLDDDEFMDVACTVDDGTSSKITQGQLVDFNKLLGRYMKGMETPGPDDRLELVNGPGGLRFKPADEKTVRITNVHMWEKAFRIYMAIYTKAHPTKAHEMVQYMHTIHHAATKYVWDNVAYYDVVFRTMMQKNPNRSWGKIYTQMWNMALCDPLPRTTAVSGFSGAKKSKGICWRFNKGICNHPQCKFAHRCTFCGGTNHGAHVCFKKTKKGEVKGNDSSGENVAPSQPKQKRASHTNTE